MVLQTLRRRCATRSCRAPWCAACPTARRSSARGAPAEEWCGVAKGAVRVSSVSLSGKQVTLTYVEPGTWFGDIALFDGLPRTHDADAHGDTTLLVVRKADFKDLLRPARRALRRAAAPELPPPAPACSTSSRT